MFEQGTTLRDIGDELGKSRETIRRWANAGQWQKPLLMKGDEGRPKRVPSTEEIEQARMRAQKASQEARTRWSVRRSEEADAAGITAAAVRQKVLEKVQAGEAMDARALAVVYGIFVDKAILMSGGDRLPGRQGDEDGPSVHGPRPTDPAEMAKAGAARALQLVRPTVDVASREA